MKICKLFLAALSLALLFSSCGRQPLTEEVIDHLFAQYHLYEKYTAYDSEAIGVDTKNIRDGYYRVTNASYDTWEEFLAWLESICCGAELESVMMDVDGLYKNIDGKTYCLAEEVESDSGKWWLSEEYTYTITEKSETEAILSVTRKNIQQLSDKDEHFTYTLQCTEDGWRIAFVDHILGDHVRADTFQS